MVQDKAIGAGVKLIALAGLSLSLSGCLMAAPSTFQLATYALDGASYAATGKSATDHVISTVADKDCAMMRALKGDDICVEKPDTVTLMPDGTRPRNANDDAFAIKPASQDQAFQAFSAANDQSNALDSDEVLNTVEPLQVASAPNAQRPDGASNMPAVPIIPVQVNPLPAPSIQDVAPSVSAAPEPVVPQPVAPQYAAPPPNAMGLFDEDEILSDEDIARLDREMKGVLGPSVEGR